MWFLIAYRTSSGKGLPLIRMNERPEKATKQMLATRSNDGFKLVRLPVASSFHFCSHIKRQLRHVILVAWHIGRKQSSPTFHNCSPAANRLRRATAAALDQR